MHHVIVKRGVALLTIFLVVAVIVFALIIMP